MALERIVRDIIIGAGVAVASVASVFGYRAYAEESQPKQKTETTQNEKNKNYFFNGFEYIPISSLERTTNILVTKANPNVKTAPSQQYLTVLRKDFNDGDPLIPNDSDFVVHVGNLDNDLISSGVLNLQYPENPDRFRTRSEYYGEKQFLSEWKAEPFTDSSYGMSIAPIGFTNFCSIVLIKRSGVPKFIFSGNLEGNPFFIHNEQITYTATNNFILRLIQSSSGNVSAWVAQDKPYQTVQDSDFVQVGHTTTSTLQTNNSLWIYSSYGFDPISRKLDTLEIKTVPSAVQHWKMYY